MYMYTHVPSPHTQLDTYTCTCKYIHVHVHVQVYTRSYSSYLRVCWVERVFSEERGEGCGLLLGPLALLYLQNEHGPALQQAHCHIHHTYSSSRVSPLTLTTILHPCIRVDYVHVHTCTHPFCMYYQSRPDPKDPVVGEGDMDGPTIELPIYMYIYMYMYIHMYNIIYSRCKNEAH